MRSKFVNDVGSWLAVLAAPVLEPASMPPAPSSRLEALPLTALQAGAEPEDAARRPPRTEAASPAIPDQFLNLAGVKVLVVDDQLTIRSLVRSGLQQIGISDVEEAADGEAGLRQAVEKTPSLIISDYNMPKLDGLGLLRAVRVHPPTAKTAFIMLTGRADKELVQRAVQYGVNNYLVKPFTVQTLKDKIEAVFGKLA